MPLNTGTPLLSCGHTVLFQHVDGEIQATERFANANELQSYSGIAPILVSSGKTSRVQWRPACPKFLRQTFHKWARCSIRYSDWARLTLRRNARGASQRKWPFDLSRSSRCGSSSDYGRITSHMRSRSTEKDSPVASNLRRRRSR